MTRPRWIMLLLALLSGLSTIVLISPVLPIFRIIAAIVMAVVILSLLALVAFLKEFTSRPQTVADPAITEKYWEALSLLPFAKAILAAVPAKTETSILNLIDRCHAIKARIYGGEGPNPPQDGPISLPGLATLHPQIFERLSAMERELSASVELMQGIRDITERSIQITNQIAQTAREAGAAAEPYLPMIHELQDLNQHSGLYSEKAIKMLDLLLSYNHANSQAILIDNDQGAQGLSEGLQSISRQIDADVQTLLESLQFQDITRQMIEGAIEIIDEAAGNLQTCENSLCDTGENSAEAKLAILEKVRLTLSNRSKTIDEKTAIAGVTQ